MAGIWERRSRSMFLGVGAISPDPGWYYHPHSHDHHELIFIVSGKMRVMTPAESATAESGDILFYRAHLVHEEVSDTKKPVSSVFFGFHHDFGDRLPPLRLNDSAGRIRELMRWLMEERANMTPEGAALRESFFQAVLAELEKLVAPRLPPLVANVRAYMEKHLEEPLDLAALARVAGMNPSAFLRKYKALTAATPMEELRMMRANRARDFLLTTNLPLKSIAPLVGFSNEYHLCRMLRRCFDLTPGQIRRNHHAAVPLVTEAAASSTVR